MQPCVGEGIAQHRLSLVFFYSHLRKKISLKFLSKLYFHLMAVAFFSACCILFENQAHENGAQVSAACDEFSALVAGQQTPSTELQDMSQCIRKVRTFSSALYVLLESLYMKMLSREKICCIFFCVVHLTF